MIRDLFLSTTPPLESLKLLSSLSPRPEILGLDNLEEEINEPFKLGSPRMKKKPSYVEIHADNQEYISSKQPDLIGLEQTGIQDGIKAESKSLSRIKLVNVMGTFKLCNPENTETFYLDLMKLYLSLKNASYLPKRFPAVIIRFISPKCTCLVFRNGKVNITGATSEINLLIGAKKCT
jgi:hypothetical protein